MFFRPAWSDMVLNRLRILPRSLSGWSLLILVNVLALMCFAQFVSLQLVSQQAQNFVERDTIADRVYVMDKMFRVSPPQQWPDLVKALDVPGFRVALTPPDLELLAQRARERPLTDAAQTAWEIWLKAQAA